MASLLHCHQQTVQRLLSEAITVLCQNSLPFRDQLSVQGLLGITLDNRDVLLVDIHERVARSGTYDAWEQGQDDRHDSERYVAAPSGKLSEDGLSMAARNNQVYGHSPHVSRLQQDQPSIAFLSKMYERQMGPYKMDPYANKQTDSSPPPRLTSPRDRAHKTHDAERLTQERGRLSALSEPPTLEAEDRNVKVERRSHDNHNGEDVKQSEGHLLLNGHSSPPALSDCASPHNTTRRSPSAVNVTHSQTSDTAISHSTAPGSSNPPQDGSTISSSSDSCLKPAPLDDRDPTTTAASSNPSSRPNQPISPSGAHRSPPHNGDQSSMTPDGDQPSQEAVRDSISLTVSKIFAHRFEGQPPLKKRLTEIAEQQNQEEQREKNPEEEEEDGAVNYTVCHSVKGKLRGSQKRKARVSYPLDLSKVSQYEEEDRDEEDLAEWGITADKEPSEEEQHPAQQNREQPHASSPTSQDPQRSPQHSDVSSLHQRAAAYEEQQQQHQQRMLMKSSGSNEDQHPPQHHQVNSVNNMNNMNTMNNINSINNMSNHSQHNSLNSVAFGASIQQQRGTHLLPHHLPVNMFEGPPLGGSGGDMGLSLMINNLVNAYSPGLPLPGLGGKPHDLSPVGYHSSKPPNLNLGSMSLGSGSPQHSPHLLSPSPAHVISPLGLNSSNNPGTPTSGDERGHKCSQCGKLVASLQGLMIHYRTHTGEKPHVCGMCGKGLSTVQGLQVHQRTHTGEKPYICTTCGKGFNDKSNMKRHIRHCTLRAPTRFLLSSPLSSPLHHMSHS